MRPSPVAEDLLRLGGAVYCVDKLARRAESADFWTRDLALHLPVSDPARWDALADVVHDALRFLSGDRWELSFTQAPSPPSFGYAAAAANDVVSLFSGGLDSLAGVIDLLEDDAQLTLVGHHDSSLTDHKQVELYKELQAHYGEDRVTLRRLLLRPAAQSREQARPLPNRDLENTTRARSFLFLSAGLAAADALGESVPLYVPENGFIGINVPLTGSRAGSLSTRTTHPYFIDRITTLMGKLDLVHPVENPYRLATKGEALSASRNPTLLARLAPSSVSCSHPEAARWREKRQGNCGYCYPCLIRRAALHHVGQDRAGDYAWDALTDADLLRRDWDSGASIRALVTSLAQPARSLDVTKNGRIPGGEGRAFFELYKRGREELLGWFLPGAGPELRSRLDDDS